MKRSGMILMVLVGFIAGIAFVYSCGGSGSGTSSEAQPSAANVFSMYAEIQPNSVYQWMTLGKSDNFVITDIYSDKVLVISGDNEVRCVTLSDGVNYSSSYLSGIRFYPSESIKIKNLHLGEPARVTITGHLDY